MATIITFDMFDDTIAADVTIFGIKYDYDDNGYDVSYNIDRIYTGDVETGEIIVLSRGDEHCDELGDDGHELLDEMIHNYAVNLKDAGKL